MTYPPAGFRRGDVLCHGLFQEFPGHCFLPLQYYDMAALIRSFTELYDHENLVIAAQGEAVALFQGVAGSGAELPAV